MGEKVKLPGDHWAILKDPMDVTERQARGVQRRYFDFGKKMRASKPRTDAVLTPDPSKPPVDEDDFDEESVDARLDLMEEWEHYLIAYLIDSWDFDSKPTAESLYDIPMPVYNRLNELTESLALEVIPVMKEQKKAAEAKDDDPPYLALPVVEQLTMLRRGEIGIDHFDPELLDAIRLHDLLEMTNWTWSIEKIESTPFITLNQLLLVHRATRDAQNRPKE